MDTEHWFAPMASNNPSVGLQVLYLSTGSFNPVNISIYSGNKLLGTTTISKNNPGKFSGIPRSQMIIENDKEKMTVSSKGIHIVGDGNFFANYRFSTLDSAEMITSKGKSALGTKFFLGMGKMKLRYSNNTAGVIATENNTIVTLSNYESSLEFTNDKTPGSSQKTVTLNKGESYVFEVDNVYGYNSDYNGLIGAKIESNKPISVSCGNFTGGISIGRDYFVDIFMDQTIPVEKIGNEYIIMNGNGDISNNARMEKTLIVASEDNTEVFLHDNSSSTPDFTLPTAGSFKFVENKLYKPIDPQNNTYSLYIRTTKPVYTYQIFSGGSDTGISSGAMSLVPPLSCLLPSKIDEISVVDENNLPPYNYDTHDVKLNIMAEKGANVFVNGSQNNLFGPFQVSGNPNWEIYYYPQAKGNISVSTNNRKSVTFGFTGGNDEIGYGGNFAGFNVDPEIKKIGGCNESSIYLEVQDDFDIYEWYYSNDKINWILLPETTNHLYPGNKYGYYQCKVTKTSCPPSILTEIFLYDKCTVIGPPQNYTLSFCENLSPLIEPKFSTDPSLPVDPTRTIILEQPAEGKVYVDNQGKIHFEPNNTHLSEVTFIYYFRGFGDFADSEQVTVTVQITQMQVKNTEITECQDSSGYAIYNLKIFEIENTDVQIIKYQYYEDSALTKEISTGELTSYKAKKNSIVYVKALNTYGCFRIGEIHLKTYTAPKIGVQINGKTATIIATEGLSPYEYAIENSNGFLPYQNSNIFSNLPLGLNTVYVMSADKCTVSTKDFMITQLFNVITPNDDGYNDILDYSELKSKENFLIKIFNTSGQMIYESNEKSYTWTGKYNGKPLPTATYWYIIQWTEPKTKQTVLQTSYLFLKNRN